MSEDRARADGNRSEWVWGGALLIASAVLPFATPQGLGVLSSASSLLSTLAFTASMLVFALGRDSIVARRPLGTTALVVLGVLSLLSWLVSVYVAAAVQDGSNTVVAALATTLTQLVPLAASIVAVVQIARAGVVPPRLRRLPLAALLVVIVPELLVQIAAVTTPPERTQDLLPLMGLASLARFVAVVGLGVVAIVAGLQPRRAEASVQVYPPVGPPPRS